MPSRAEIAHLLRRATFGPRADDVDTAERTGVDATVAALLRPTTSDAGAAATPEPRPGPDPLLALGPHPARDAALAARQQRRTQQRDLTLWWLDRMIAAEHQFAEKLVFFWHGHWATSVQKVGVAALMLGQQHTFRQYGRGDFGALLPAMLRDPALIIWLDGQKNTRQAPNENLARELMELFTLGIGNYTETDVRQAARALTGWQLDRAGQRAVFNPARHDDGVKTVLGRTGRFDADGFAEVLLAQPAHARYLASRLWFRFASPDPIPADTLARLVAAYGPGHDVTALMRALFTDPAFASTTARLVKQPVEWLVGAARQLGVRPGGLTRAQQDQLLRGAAAMGQVLFAPPSVGGWPAGTAWLTTSAPRYRLTLAQFLVAHAAPGTLHQVEAVPARQRPDALARLLVVDGWTDRTRAVLADLAGDPRKLLSYALISPEYTVC